MKLIFQSAIIFAFACGVLAWPPASENLTQGTKPTPALRPRSQAPTLPLVFEPNRGQFRSEVQFRARDNGYTLLLTRRGIEIVTRAPASREVRQPIVIEFGETAGGLRWEGSEALAARASYFLGREKSKWARGVPLFAGAATRNAAPGIDCRVYAGPNGIEFDFGVEPGADPRRLHFVVRNTWGILLDEKGNLVLNVRDVAIRLQKPKIYQANRSEIIPIEGSFVLGAHKRVSFRIPRFDPTKRLVIDPSISVSYMTFLGGLGTDTATSVAFDSTGKVYVAGKTTAANFDLNTAKVLGPGGGPSDFFVAKFDPTKTGVASLIFLAFIGGTGDEESPSLAVNANGQAVLAGTTTSSDFPVTDSTKRTSGANDLAVSMLNATGDSLVFATLAGGNGVQDTQDKGGVAFDPAGDVVVVGDTTSTNLPVTVGAFRTAYGGGASDGFLITFSPAGILSYLSYLGINAQVGVSGVAVDLVGQSHISGFTSAPSGTSFPTLHGFQASYGGGAFDAFLINLKPKGLGENDLIYSTFLGGSGSDEGFAVAVDGSVPSNAYVGGTTASSDFPTNGVHAGFQTMLQGTANGFLAAVSQDGTTGATSLSYATYFGGSASDSVLGLFVLNTNAIYAGGHTASFNFPTLNTLQSFSGSSDAFIAKFNPTVNSAASLLYSTLLGGSNDAQANAVAATSNGAVAAAGSSDSPDFPLAGNPSTGFQPVCASCNQTPPLSDAFLFVASESAAGGPQVSFDVPRLNFGPQLVGTSSPPQTVTLTNSGESALTISGITIIGANRVDFSEVNTCPLAPATLAAGSTCAITGTFTPSIAGGETAAISVTDDAPGSPQTVNLLGTGEEPIAGLSTVSIAFGNQPEGTTSAQQSVTMTNSGNIPLQVAVVALSGPDVSQFAIVPPITCTSPPTVQPGASCTVSVAFEPKTTGTFSAGLDFTDNSGNVSSAKQSVALSGTGTQAAPVVNLNPLVLAFNPVGVGETSAPQTITLGNTGSLPLQISSVALAGSSPGDFKIASGTTCPVNGGTLNPGAQCNVNAVFAPQTAGVKVALISFSDNGLDNPQGVSLSGTASANTVTVSPTSLTFPSQTDGTQSAPQSVTLSNTGSSAIQISSLAITGMNSGDFSQASNCPATLNAGANCLINVTFTPSAAGNRSATLGISDDAAGNPQTVGLTGTGLAPTADLSASTASFVSQLVGTKSAPMQITISNNGSGSLIVGSLNLSGTNAAEFSAGQNCGSSLRPGSSCMVSIVFQPTASGTPSATLAINDNAPNTPQSIALNGTATDITVGPAPDGSQVAVVNAGQPATYNLQIAPSGGFTGTVTLNCTGAPAQAGCSESPNPLTLSGASPAAFTVTVTTKKGSGIVAAQITLFLLAMIAAGGLRSGRRPRSALAAPAGALLVLAMLMLSACGSAGGGGAQTVPTAGTPPGTYTLTISASDQGSTRTLPLTLVVNP